MAALGAVAAGEYLANREEAGDQARIAAMQGQSMALPGGAPPGYVPVPTGYPQPPYYGGPSPAGNNLISYLLSPTSIYNIPDI